MMSRLVKMLSSIAMGVALLSVATAAEVGGAKDNSSQKLSQIWPSKASGPPEKVVYDAASAMDFLRTLGGEWDTTVISNADQSGAKSKMADDHVHNSSSFDATMKYRVFAHGSVVQLIFQEGTPKEMMQMYSMDGPNKLLAEHFCERKNVVNQEFVPSNVPGEIRWKLAGGTNLNLKTDSYTRMDSIKILDKDTFEIRGAVVTAGEATPTTAVHHRKALKATTAAAN